MDLSRYDNSDYHTGAGIVRRSIWYVVNALVFDSWWMPVSAPKRMLLRLFGARIGRGVVIKPRVNVKYPWNLAIGDHTWIGEGAWIESLVRIDIGANVCISQGAYLLTGNHDYTDETFNLVTKPITVEDSVWIGAFVIVCPGVTLRRASVLSVRCVVSADTEEAWVYKGSPAVKVRPRYLRTVSSPPAGLSSPAAAPASRASRQAGP